MEASDMTGKPEGWYDSPDDPNWRRWWNGSEWTDHAELKLKRDRIEIVDESDDDYSEYGEVTIRNSDEPDALFWVGIVAGVLIPVVGLVFAIFAFANSRPSQAGAFILSAVVGVILYLVVFGSG